MKPVSFVAYGDIGRQTGRPITELSRGLHRRDLLEQVFCRGVETYDLPEHLVTAPIPFGRAVPRAMTGINRYVTKRFDKRYYAEQLFDTFAARAVDETEIQLHHTPGYLQTLRAGNRSRSRTVVKVTTEYADACYRRVAAEHERLGLIASEPETQRKRIESQHLTLAECDEILAISSFVKRSLVEAGFSAERITVTPLGVNAEDYPTTSAEQSGPFTVLYVGSVTIAKGIPYLLEAWQRNGWGDDDDVRLCLCGHVSTTMRAMLSEFGFTNVETPGHVDPREYHQTASIFVFPSVSDGFGRAPLEAMAAGLPVITTDRTGIADIVTDGEEGFIVPASDAATLADRLGQLRERPSMRQRMRQRALDTAAAQTWDNHTTKVIEGLGLAP